MSSIVSLFIFLDKIEVGSLKILKPGVTTRLKGNQLLSRLSFTIYSTTQSHFECTLSILVTTVSFWLNYVPPGFFFFVKPRTTFNS